MKTKLCNKCNDEKPLTKEFFHKNKSSKSGFQSVCKVCANQYSKKWRKENKDYHKEYSKKWAEGNPEYNAIYRREVMGISPRVLLTEEEKKERRRKYSRNQQRELRKDPMYRMRSNIRTMVWLGLKRNGGSKAGESFFEKLPYTSNDLKEHLERQFDDKMNWDNYGSYWHVDHIHPQSLLPFDSFDHPNFLKCWSLNNLQPLERIENIRKSNKVL
jgi:hypothetical protein